MLSLKKERMDPPKGSKKDDRENAQPPHPLEDFTALETEQVVRICVGDMIQTFWDPPTP